MNDVLEELFARASGLWDCEFKIYARVLLTDGSCFDGWPMTSTSNAWAKRYRKHPLKVGIDAELVAMTQALLHGHDLKGSTLYVVRAKRACREGPFIRGLAKPCRGCETAARDFGVGTVVYTTDDPDIIGIMELSR